jgi:hypothetical protein
MATPTDRQPGTRAEPWIGAALCVATAAAWSAGQLVPDRLTYADIFAPTWLPLVAAGAGLTAILLPHVPAAAAIRSPMRWAGLLLLVWAANGLPIDLFRAVGLIPLGVDWPGLGTRALAMAAAVVLGRTVLAGLFTSPAAHPATWYAYAAFLLALPYPLLRTHWVLGGSLGLLWPGAAGTGIEAWLPSIPFVMAAALSLLLASPREWIPRRPLVLAGWSATAVVAMVGPAACWALVSTLATGGDTGFEGIALWVPALFYGSWLLWAIAAAAATRSYQVRSARPTTA